MWFTIFVPQFISVICYCYTTPTWKTKRFQCPLAIYSEHEILGLDEFEFLAKDENLSAKASEFPEHGLISGTQINQYIPDANYFGEDSFTYVANDGVYDSNPALVSINVHNINDRPFVQSDVDKVMYI
ncbi:RTX toxin domain protein [Candidatus Magnetomorum sp. HK-1]|nr:RTX toxin domain protein [Candidatus Magnetomorum sp. HK-1]